MVMQYPEPRIPTKAARTEDSTCTADIDRNFSAQPLPCLWGYLGLGSTGSLTAQLFPQPSRPKHPQPSSLCSPMNTAAGMSTWEHSKQTTPFLLVAQRGQTKYTLGNAFMLLLVGQSVQVIRICTHLTQGILLLTSPTPGQVRWGAIAVAILHLTTERDCWGIATFKVFQL